MKPQIITCKQDLTSLSWAKACQSSGAAGTFLKSFDVMADLPVQSFLGSRSAWGNLKLIPPAELPKLNPLRTSDQATLFDGLDVATTPLWREKAWTMIWERWCAYEAFCTERQR